MVMNQFISIGKLETGPKVIEPHFLMEIHLMFGDADFEEWHELGRFEKNTLRLIYFNNAKKHYMITPEEKAHFDGLNCGIHLEPEKDTMLDAIVTCELAIKNGTRMVGGDYRKWDSYEHIPGFYNFFYDKLPYKKDMTPIIQAWRIRWLNKKGQRHDVTIKLPEEKQRFIDEWLTAQKER